MTVKTDLKHRNIKALDPLIGRCRAMTPIRGEIACNRSSSVLTTVSNFHKEVA